MVGVSSRQFLFNLPYLHQALDKICITPQQQQNRGKHIAPNWEQRTIETFHITERDFLENGNSWDRKPCLVLCDNF